MQKNSIGSLKVAIKSRERNRRTRYLLPGVENSMQIFSVDGRQFYLSGRFPRICGLYNSWYESVEDPEALTKLLKKVKQRADVFTFFQRPPHVEPSYNYHMEPYPVSVIKITTYEDWFNKGIGKKTRHAIRSAQKKGVEVRVEDFNSQLVKGICEICNETPIRAGKKYPHYKATFEEVRDGSATFLDRSIFLGAYYRDEFIGFTKIVFEDEFADILQHLAKISHRDKYTANILMAKAVELCTVRGSGYLAYGDWDESGVGDYKRHNGFVRMDLPRYYIPLNWMGAVALKIKLHRPISKMLPAKTMPLLKGMRLKWQKMKVKA